jgi:hypothetical protein
MSLGLMFPVIFGLGYSSDREEWNGPGRREIYLGIGWTPKQALRT